MELFLKIVSPIQSYDFQTFSHNLLLTLPASSLIGLILFTAKPSLGNFFRLNFLILSGLDATLEVLGASK